MFEDLLTNIDEDNLYTENCIICLKPAVSFSGHVMKGDIAITAGWCDDHRSKIREVPDLMGRVGCCGGWHSDYGSENTHYDDEGD
jgi:hypothetical protein